VRQCSLLLGRFVFAASLARTAVRDLPERRDGASTGKYKENIFPFFFHWKKSMGGGVVLMVALVVAAVLGVCGSAVVDDEARPRVGGLVCRRCGMELVSGPADVLEVASGAAVGAYRAALFGNETTTDARGRSEEAGEDHDNEEEEEDKGKQLVQHFVNPEGHTFEVITARWKDLYMHTDQAFSQDSWFEYARPSSITNSL
jgi:hypothetical protein